MVTLHCKCLFYWYSRESYDWKTYLRFSLIQYLSTQKQCFLTHVWAGTGKCYVSVLKDVGEIDKLHRVIQHLSSNDGLAVLSFLHSCICLSFSFLFLLFSSCLSYLLPSFFSLCIIYSFRRIQTLMVEKNICHYYDSTTQIITWYFQQNNERFCVPSLFSLLLPSVFHSRSLSVPSNPAERIGPSCHKLCHTDTPGHDSLERLQIISATGKGLQGMACLHWFCMIGHVSFCFVFVFLRSLSFCAPFFFFFGPLFFCHYTRQEQRPLCWSRSTEQSWLRPCHTPLLTFSQWQVNMEDVALVFMVVEPANKLIFFSVSSFQIFKENAVNQS